MARGGYAEMPYQVPRWAQASGEIYGRGLGESVLADVKMLNRMDRTTIRAAQKVADPPLLAGDEGVIKAARTYSGGITYGAIDSAGNPLLKPLYTGANVSVAFEMMEARRNTIRDGFYFSLMQMVGSPNMTATEWLGRQEEKLRLMGPEPRAHSDRVPVAADQPPLRHPVARQPIAARAAGDSRLSAARRIRLAAGARADGGRGARGRAPLRKRAADRQESDPSVIDNVDHDEAVQNARARLGGAGEDHARQGAGGGNARGARTMRWRARCQRHAKARTFCTR